MLIGYARVSKADGSQAHDLQRDALVAAGITADQIYEDSASGRRDDRPGLDACLKALRAGDSIRHMRELVRKGVGPEASAGDGIGSTPP